jgi:uncharacterized protein YjiS (DUF1127 family)
MMKRFWAALARAWVLAKTRRELHGLSDHMLRDIGLRRDQLSSGFLKRVVLAEPRLAEFRAGGLVAEADRRREVASP